MYMVLSFAYRQLCFDHDIHEDDSSNGIFSSSSLSLPQSSSTAANHSFYSFHEEFIFSYYHTRPP